MTQFGNQFPNVLVGSAPDTILGLAGGDTIASAFDGLSGLYGNEGNDSLRSQGSGDTMWGGQGDDTLTSSGNALMYGDLGNDLLNSVAGLGLFGAGGGGNDTMYGLEGDDTLVAGPGGNTAMYGNEGNDNITASKGSDTGWGGQGNDVLNAAPTGGGILYGDLGNDVLNANNGSNGGASLYGLDGDDTLNSAGSGGNFLFGNGGTDSLKGGYKDSLFGGSGADALTATGSGVYMSGDLDGDTLTGLANATMLGGGGNDELNVGGNRTSASGGAGDDLIKILAGGGSGSSILGGDGNDVIDATADTAGGATLNGEGGNNTIRSSGKNVIISGSGADTISGSTGDTVLGLGPEDVLVQLGSGIIVGAGSTAVGVTGDSGDNSLRGGDAADTIEGFGGKDTMTGGGGADVFVFQPGKGATNMASIARIGSVQGLALAGILDANGVGTVTYSFNAANGTFATSSAGTFSIGGQTFNATAVSGTAVVANTYGGTVLTGPILNRTDIAYGAAATFQTGTLAAVALGSSSGAATGVTLASSDYGYATTGVDVITDFQKGIDQIRISSSLMNGLTNAVTPAAPGQFTSVAGFSGTNSIGAIDEAFNFIYDTTTGILYFNPGATTGDDTAVLGNTTATVRAGETYAVGTNGPGPGTSAFASVVNAPTGGEAFKLAYTFGTSSTSGVKDIGAAAEIPFLQVLNNGAVVSNLSYSTDIVIF